MSDMTPVVGLGAGGHAKVVIDILRLSGGFELVGLLDANPSLVGTSVNDVPVLGNDELLSEMRRRGIKHAFIGLGSTGASSVRRRLFELAHSTGFEMINSIHPSAVVAPSVLLEEGVTIMAGAIANASARIGRNVIINTGAIVEHDCVLGDHVHVATAAALAGMVVVGNETHIGIGARVRQCCRIGARVTVGAGAVVVADVADDVVVAGVPARVISHASAADSR
jgi:UDP-perosamine 4-acetyltransferase